MRVVSRSKLLLAVLLLVLSAGGVETSRAQSSLNPGYAAQDAQYSPSARAGREIWFFATAFNDRFYTYSYPQRLGASIDWYKILAAKNKADLFPGWGVTPDPDCCVPGDPSCPAGRSEETYGFQCCKGDEELLKFVGRTGYHRDPACDFKDAPFNAHARAREGSAAEPLRPAVRHLDRRAWLAQIPQSPLRRREMAQAQRLARTLGRLRQVPVRRSGRRRLARQRGCSTARSSRRSGSACLAARATSPTIRRSRRPIRTIRNGRTSTAWSAISTAASRRSSPRACRSI